MNIEVRREMIDRIESNIARHGHHVYLVSGGSQTPQYAYSIGLHTSVGYEVVLAGASFFNHAELHHIVNQAAIALRADPACRRILLGELGAFELQKCDSSWTLDLLLGAVDFYSTQQIAALQITPDEVHATNDIPDMSTPWNFDLAGAWKWLKTDWPYSVPHDAVAVTNLGALRGELVTEVVRWGQNEWEAFSIPGPDVLPSDVRYVPVSTLLTDESLLPILDLVEGDGRWRDSDELVWNKWERQAK